MQSLKKIHAWAQMQVPLSVNITTKSYTCTNNIFLNLTVYTEAVRSENTCLLNCLRSR